MIATRGHHRCRAALVLTSASKFVTEERERRGRERWEGAKEAPETAATFSVTESGIEKGASIRTTSDDPVAQIVSIESKMQTIDLHFPFATFHDRSGQEEGREGGRVKRRST